MAFREVAMFEVKEVIRLHGVSGGRDPVNSDGYGRDIPASRTPGPAPDPGV